MVFKYLISLERPDARWMRDGMIKPRYILRKYVVRIAGRWNYLKVVCRVIWGALGWRPLGRLWGYTAPNAMRRPWMASYEDSVVFLRGQSSSWPLKVGPIGCPETSVRNYHSVLCNIPEQRVSLIPQLGHVAQSAMLYLRFQIQFHLANKMIYLLRISHSEFPLVSNHFTIRLRIY